MNFNDITFFKTAQGSKYIRLPDGRLRRWKSSHANTGGEDMGLHSWSTQSIFVDPKFEHPANSIQYLVGKGYKVALSKDAEGKMFPMIVDNGQWRPATWGDAYSVYARQNPEVAKKVLSWKYSKEPIVGYHVVDFDLKGGDRGTEIKGYHFGSPVSEIGSLSDEDKKLFFPSQSNLQESIYKILMENKIPDSPQRLIKSLPQELKDLLFKQWGAKQNPEWHPEGNTLKHIIVVLKRAYHHYPDDPNMIMAALFHDLGKLDTYGVHPKTGHPTAYGHEYKSTDYVEQFRSWIESFEGTDVDEIKYLVKNHMKVKPRTWGSMRDTKKEPIMKNKSFDKLMGFTDKLDGGGTDLKESIKRILREETTPITKVISHLVDQHYNVGYEDEVNRKFLLLTITLTPKTDKSKRYGNIIFYSSWEEDTRRRGQIKNYDTNSAYNEGGMFKPMGLEKALSSWLYEKSKEIANNLKDKIIRDIY